MSDQMSVDQKPVDISEQETIIQYSRDEGFASIYTTDRTQMTRLDKLCAESPDYYKLMKFDGYGKQYHVSDKKLISFRSRRSSREMTPEQRAAAGERLRRHRENEFVQNQKI